MVRLQVPRISYSEFRMSLAGNTYIFDYSFNDREQRWYLNISDSNKNLIVGSLKLIEGTSPTIHLELEGFDKGFLQVTQLQEDPLPASRHNLGIDKSYDLEFVTFAELE